jgi:hypothetical protein
MVLRGVYARYSSGRALRLSPVLACNQNRGGSGPRGIIHALPNEFDFRSLFAHAVDALSY